MKKSEIRNITGIIQAAPICNVLNKKVINTAILMEAKFITDDPLALSSVCCITWVTRFLSVYRKFLNPNFSLITPKEYQQANGLRRELILDSVFSLIRGSAIGLLTYELTRRISPWNYIIGAGIGALASSHSFHSNYMMRRNQDAVNKLSPEELELRRKTAALSQENKNTDTETAPLLVNSEKPSEQDPIARKNSYFDEIAKTQNSRKLELAVDAVVNATMLVRFFAFCLFVKSVNDSLINNSISPYALFALTFLWGMEVYKNDRELYRRALTGNLTAKGALWQLEKHVEASSGSQNYGRFFNVFRKSAYDYSEETLKETLEEVTKEVKKAKETKETNEMYVSPEQLTI